VFEAVAHHFPLVSLNHREWGIYSPEIESHSFSDHTGGHIGVVSNVVDVIVGTCMVNAQKEEI
jgi:hypothetical protein